MNNPESIQIINRFFEVLNVLILHKTLRGKKTFCDLYEINRRHFYIVEKNPKSDMFQMSWLMHMINDFNVSPEWLMTGRGKMFKQ